MSMNPTQPSEPEITDEMIVAALQIWLYQDEPRPLSSYGRSLIEDARRMLAAALKVSPNTQQIQISKEISHEFH